MNLKLEFRIFPLWKTQTRASLWIKPTYKLATLANRSSPAARKSTAMRPFAFGEPALPTHSCGVRFAHTLSKTRGLIAAPSRSPLGYLPHDDGEGRILPTVQPGTAMTVHGDSSPGKASRVSRGALLFTPANHVGLPFDS